MKRKERNLRLAISGIMLLAVAAAGIGIYRVNQRESRDLGPQIQGEEFAEETPLSEEEAAGQPEESADVNTPNAQIETQEKPKEEAEQETKEADADRQESSEVTAHEILPALDFSENTAMIWPVSGDVLIDYSMDGAVYFPTLEVYKYNPALILGAEVDQQVQAAANSRVLSVNEDAETGLTVAMDMGNGYRAVYGQLKEVTVEPEQIIAAGTVIGTIAEPTKYYAAEGSNLYFSLSKDGQAVDPFLHLPTEEE